MYIEKLSIVSFGVLKDKEYVLSDGFNIVEGSNESGKSTLMNFVLFVLYGADSDLTKRMKAGGEVFSGKITLVCDKFGEITVSRTASAIGTKVSDTVAVTSCETLKELNTGKLTPGDFLLGINREFFENTVFVSQSGASKYDAGTTSVAVQNILNSANEKMSTDKGKKKLDETRKNLKHKNNKGGAIYTISSELAILEAELEGNKNGRVLLCEAEEKIKRLQADSRALDAIPQLIANEKAARSTQKLHNINELRSTLQNEKDQKKKALENITAINEAYRTEDTLSELRKLDVEVKLQKAKIEVMDNSLKLATDQYDSMNEKKHLIPESIDSYIESIQNISYSAKKYFFAAIAVFSLAVIAVLLGIICVIYSELIISVTSFSCCLIALVGGFMLLAKRSTELREMRKELAAYAFDPYATLREIHDEITRRKDFERLKETKQKEIEQLNQSIGAEYNLCNEKIKELTVLLAAVISTDLEIPIEDQIQYAEHKINQSYENESAIRHELNEISCRIGILNEEITHYSQYSDADAIPDPRFSEYSDSELDDYLHSAIKRKDAISEEIQQLSIQITALEGRMRPEECISEEIYEKKQLLKTREEQFEIVSLAQEALDKASENIRCAVTPNIIKICDSLLAEVTNGKYEHIGLDASLSLNGISGEETRKHTELSYGTNEAMYLAFRLSLCTVLCQSEMPPLMLDESLAHIDDIRSSLIMKMLSGINAQTILFTCSKREAYIARNNGLSFNLINI